MESSPCFLVEAGRADKARRRSCAAHQNAGLEGAFIKYLWTNEIIPAKEKELLLGKDISFRFFFLQRFLILVSLFTYFATMHSPLRRSIWLETAR